MIVAVVKNSGIRVGKSFPNHFQDIASATNFSYRINSQLSLSHNTGTLGHGNRVKQYVAATAPEIILVVELAAQVSSVFCGVDLLLTSPDVISYLRADSLAIVYFERDFFLFFDRKPSMPPKPSSSADFTV